MRILTIGLGRAGCRIVDCLLAHDRKAPVHCVFGIAIDCDAGQLNSLQHVPLDQRLFFQPLDPSHPGDLAEHLPSEEALSRLQALDDGDIDALFVCTGLGGTMAGTAPNLVAYLKKSMTEPVFCLCTLPCRQEGDGCSSRAADQLDTLKDLVDGIVLFDNESWLDKIPEVTEGPPLSRPADLGTLVARHQGPPLSETERFFFNFNDLICRRFTLLLRAGEYSERSPGELPEVVLDAGEILNTIKGMGFITMGYARDEVVPGHSMDLLSRFRKDTPTVQESHLKASRVVELTKRAIFHEISTPTELGQAEKALILIAGPSHEMSMRGFMTVRKWIDRTIKGLELRSGDYPVSGSRFVGVFIVLAGMDSLPRVEELRQVRARVRGTDPSVPGDDPGT